MNQKKFIIFAIIHSLNFEVLGHYLYIKYLDMQKILTYGSRDTQVSHDQHFIE